MKRLRPDAGGRADESVRVRDVDPQAARRLRLNLVANIFSRLSGSGAQFVSVPIFLHFWSVPTYGAWLLLSTMPAYLSLSDMGFGNVAGNEMTFKVARGDWAAASRVFQSTLALIYITCIPIAGVLTIAIWWLPINSVLHTNAISPSTSRMVFVLLLWSVVVGQVEILIQGAFRAIGRYAFGIVMYSVVLLLEFGSTILALVVGGDPVAAAAALTGTSIIGTAAMCVILRRQVSWVRFGTRDARLTELKRMAKPAAGFFVFPLAQALSLQGVVLIVGGTMGAASVVVFSTARTLARTATQIGQLVKLTVWPEMSIAHGKGTRTAIRALHRQACKAVLVSTLPLALPMIVVGDSLVHVWTGGHVFPSRALLAVLVTDVLFFALWSTSATLQQATNTHVRFTAYYLVLTVASLGVAYYFGEQKNLALLATSGLAVDTMMTCYVLPRSLRMTEDSFARFTRSLFSITPRQSVRVVAAADADSLSDVR
jgi:O-antigen/teichoic acid export membrane protein